MLFRSATYNYIGSGAGSKQFYIKSGNIQSEIFVTDDCYWIEKSSSTNNYVVTGGTLTINGGVFEFTKGSSNSNFYLNIPKSHLPLSDFLNKELIIKADIISFNATQLRMTAFTNDGTEWSSPQIIDVSAIGTIENRINIPSNTTQIRIRFDIYGNENDNVVFKDFRFILN